MNDHDFIDTDKKYETIIKEFAEFFTMRTLKENLDEEVYNLDRLCSKITNSHMKYIYCDV